MKEVEVGGVKVLLLKSQGTYHAMGAKCTHYGAPLVNGEYMLCLLLLVLFQLVSLLLASERQNTINLLVVGCVISHPLTVMQMIGICSTL